MSICTVYVPALSGPVAYLPSLSVVRESGTSAVIEFTNTVAPATGAPAASITVPSIEPLGSSSWASAQGPTTNRIKRQEIQEKIRSGVRCPKAAEARNFDKRFSAALGQQAGIATWNHSPREWLLSLSRVELVILLEGMDIRRK